MTFSLAQHEVNLRIAREGRREWVRQWLLASCAKLMQDHEGNLRFWGSTSAPPWCLYCSSRHWGPEREPCMVVARREKSGSSSGNSSAVALPGKVLIAFANVLEFLSMTSWPDGAPRTVGTLTLTTEEGLWKVTLKDRDSQGVAFVTAETPDVLLKALDQGIASGKLEWRNDKFQGGNGKRRS